MNKKRESLSSRLHISLNQEKGSIKERKFGIEEKIANAEKIFSSHETFNIEKNNIRVKKDTFTIPEEEYALIDILKNKLLKQGMYMNKSEIMRAGLLLLSDLNDNNLKCHCAKVDKLKTGRPKKND